jgi:hypothetical protein
MADGFAFFRYDDDFTYLSDPSKRISWYDEIKYIPLGAEASHYLSIGGDLRERVESYSDGYFGLADAPHTTYLLSRALLDADLHWEDARAFVQLGNAVEWNRQPAALPTDDNRGDVQQALMDLHVYPNHAVDFQYTGAGLWRYSTHDAFYAAPLFPLIPGGSLGVPLYTLVPTTVPTTLRTSGVIAPVRPTGCVML